MSPSSNQTLDEIYKALDDLWNQSREDVTSASLSIQHEIQSWMNSLIAVCFGVGGVALSITPKVHHRLFWLGGTILIITGVIIVFLNKWYIELKDKNTIPAREFIPEILKARNIVGEMKGGNFTRSQEFESFRQRSLAKQAKAGEKYTKHQWAKFTIIACIPDIILALFLLGITLIASQVVYFFKISDYLYYHLMVFLLFIYTVSTYLQAKKVVLMQRRAQIAEAQSNSELIPENKVR